MDIVNRPNQLTHRTRNPPVGWPELNGTGGLKEVNRAFREHRYELIWALMDAACCPGHGDHEITIQMDINCTLYRTIKPSGYIYWGNLHPFRNVIVVTANCNFVDLNINVRELTQEERQAEFHHNHFAIASPGGTRLHQGPDGFLSVSLREIDALWKQHYENEVIQGLMNINIDD